MVAALSQSNPHSGLSSTAHHVMTCAHCGQTQQLPKIPIGCRATCVRCRETLQQHAPRGVQRTIALSLAALILFVPANTLPILSLSRMGHRSESTILGGVVELWESGTQGIAVLVLFCSILIPLLKILGLLYLCASYQIHSPKRYSAMLRFITLIGRWSMLDVFLVAILVALVKLGTFASIQPELGIVAFAGVVVLTMIASTNFDSKLLWLQQDHNR
ncbi:MAG TPA: paraquat-inducible protein A [Phycisphaerales bacterium]|nr:paraquat-inducible protein A [Phycisphaerales bacterium]